MSGLKREQGWQGERSYKWPKDARHIPLGAMRVYPTPLSPPATFLPLPLKLMAPTPSLVPQTRLDWHGFVDKDGPITFLELQRY